MKEKEFDELLRKAVAARCRASVPENLESLIESKLCAGRKKRRYMLMGATVSAAAAVAAIAIVVGQHDTSAIVPGFYEEIRLHAESRLFESSDVSIQLRNETDIQYAQIQLCYEK